MSPQKTLRQWCPPARSPSPTAASATPTPPLSLRLSVSWRVAPAACPCDAIPWYWYPERSQLPDLPLPPSQLCLGACSYRLLAFPPTPPSVLCPAHPPSPAPHRTVPPHHLDLKDPGAPPVRTCPPQFFFHYSIRFKRNNPSSSQPFIAVPPIHQHLVCD